MDGTEVQVGVGRRAEWVAHHEETHVDLGGFGQALEEFVDFDLAEIAIGLYQLSAEELSELLDAHTHYRRVELQVDLLGGLDGVHSSDGDVLG